MVMELEKVTQADSECPFVELSFFTEETSGFFFGRDAERKTIIANLRASQLTLLHAVSGTGKSSLLRAGVAHRLRELAKKNFRERGSAGFVPVVCSSWTESPVTEVVRQIERSIGTLYADGDRPVLPQRLDLAITAAAQLVDARLLIMLDQFEEYSLYRSGDASKGLLVEQLAHTINQPDIRANFLISIREDAYASLGDLFRGRITNLYSNYLSLDKLSRERAEEAIRNPIQRYNELHPSQSPVEIERELVDEILKQVSVGSIAGNSTGLGSIAGNSTGLGSIDGNDGTDAIEAPYLQLVMTRLWQTEQQIWEIQQPQDPRVLHLSTLRQLGGAEEIVRTHLDATLEQLSPKERDLAADVFHHLVTPSGAKIAQNVPDLADYAHHSNAEIETVLEGLARSDARVLRRVDPPAGAQGGAKYEIFHDVLAPAILGWRQRVETDRLRKRVKQAHRLIVAAVIATLILVGGGFGIWHLVNEPTPAEQLRAIVPTTPGVSCIEQSKASYAASSEDAQENCDYSKTSGPIDVAFYELFPSASSMKKAFNGFIPAANKQAASCDNFNAFVNNCVATYGSGKGYGQMWENYLGTGKNRFPVITATSTKWAIIVELNGITGDSGNDLLSYFNESAAGSTNGFVSGRS